MKHVQFIRQTPTEAADYVGLEGEIVVETVSYQIRVHDGATLGGFIGLTEATARGLFVTQEDFDTQLAAFISTLEAENAAAQNTIAQLSFISRAPVIDIITGPPGGPSAGDRYLVAHSSLTGVFVGQADQVAEYGDDDTWHFSGPPSDGHIVFVQSAQTQYFFHSGTGLWDDVDPSLDALKADIAAESAADTAALALKAPLASPALTGVPTAPTADPATDDTQLATTAFANTAAANAIDDFITADFVKSFGSFTGSGYQKFPGGLIMQWAMGTQDPNTNTADQQLIAFPLTFPTACVACQVSIYQATAAQMDFIYTIVGEPTTTGVTVKRYRPDASFHGNVTTPVIFAIGY